jgi:hypothetical protein
MRNEYYKVMVPKMKPIISEADSDALKMYFNERDNGNVGRFDL